jgi:4-diphosphocytidyl-2C-methyl-D-erythritol kinase
MWNALERPAFSLHPPLADLKGQILGHEALAAFLSGSGSAIVGYFRDRASAEAARLALSREHPHTFVALPSSSGVVRDPRSTLPS